MSAVLILLFTITIVIFCSVVLVLSRRLLPLFGRDPKLLSPGSVTAAALMSDEPLTARYRPMERLLRESEWEYLQHQPGFSPARLRTVKAERRKLFRGYLGSLSNDFAVVCQLLRIVMVQSSVARPDLAIALGKFRLQYSVALVKIEFRLMAHAMGISSIQIDVSNLIRSLDELGSQLRLAATLSPLTPAAGYSA
jgi:hypothetical protein